VRDFVVSTEFAGEALLLFSSHVEARNCRAVVPKEI
jgi:hypothetical protein